VTWVSSGPAVGASSRPGAVPVVLPVRSCSPGGSYGTAVEGHMRCPAMLPLEVRLAGRRLRVVVDLLPPDVLELAAAVVVALVGAGHVGDQLRFGVVVGHGAVGAGQTADGDRRLCQLILARLSDRRPG
jgi:hypothetical protein